MLVLSKFIGLAGGYYVDSWLGTSPWGVLPENSWFANVCLFAD